MASDLEALLDALEIERLTVVGWSMGGYVAQRLARRAPGRVVALGLISTDPGGPAAVPARPETWAALVDHSGTPREQASRLISLLFPPAVAAEIDRQFGEVVAAARRPWSSTAPSRSSSRPPTRRRWPRFGPARASSCSKAAVTSRWRRSLGAR
jgi:pimeloyl-ACP methyl ester carboxylesterase